MPQERGPETDVGQIWIDGMPFHCINMSGDISNIFARGVTQGDAKADDHPIFAKSAQRDWAGGWLVLDQNAASDTTRFAESTCETQYPGVITLPALTRELAAPNGETGAPYMVGDFAGSFYVAWGTNLYKYNTTTLTPTLIGDMGSSPLNTGQVYRTQDTLADIPGESILWIPVIGGYRTVSNLGVLDVGTALSDVVSFEIWDQKLWRLMADGTLWWTIVLPASEADWTYDCGILDESRPTHLISYLRMDREPCLVVITDGQTWKHDFTNHALHAEDLWYPRHPYHGLGAIKHRSDVLVTASTGIYTYDNNTISPDNGLDSRNGLPARYRGHIVSLASGLNDFYALTQGAAFATGDDVVDTMEVAAGLVDTMELDPLNTSNLLLRHNGFGWHYVWHGQGGTPSNVLTSNQLGRYTIWWGSGSTLYMQVLPTTYFNPDDPDAVFTDRALSCRHYASWVDWGWMGQPKILKMIETDLDRMEHEGHKVTLWYRIDQYQADLIKLGERTESGEWRWFLGQDPDEPTLPNGRGKYRGEPHERIQLIIDLERGASEGDERNSPVVKRHLMMARKWLRPQFTYRLRLDCTKESRDYPRAVQLAHLQRIAQEQLAVVFQYQMEHVMVDLVVEDFSMGSGREVEGIINVTLIESLEKSLELEQGPYLAP